MDVAARDRALRQLGGKLEAKRAQLIAHRAQLEERAKDNSRLNSVVEMYRQVEAGCNSEHECLVAAFQLLLDTIDPDSPDAWRDSEEIRELLANIQSKHR